MNYILLLICLFPLVKIQKQGYVLWTLDTDDEKFMQHNQFTSLVRKANIYKVSEDLSLTITK